MRFMSSALRGDAAERETRAECSEIVATDGLRPGHWADWGVTMNHRRDRRVATSRLFHTVVVIGASMGCGLEVSPLVDAGPGDAGPGDAGAVVPDTGVFIAPVFAVDAGADANEGGPRSVCDCPEPGQFVCASCAGGDAPVLGHCPHEDGVGCWCDSTRTLTGPDQCAEPAFYTCALEPDAGAPAVGYYAWFQYADCWCDPTRPTTQDDCNSLDAGLQLQCQVNDCINSSLTPVYFDCACLPPIPTIR